MYFISVIVSLIKSIAYREIRLYLNYILDYDKEKFKD